MSEFRTWREVRAEVIRTPEDEARVAAARAELEADYQRLADTDDGEGEQYRRAMRARKRGRPED